MRSINWLILLLLILVITAATVVYSGLDSNNVNIVVNTNGTTTTVNYQTVLWGSISTNMQKEIKNKASEDIQSDTSTVDSIKADLKTIASKYNYNADVNIVSQFGNDQLPLRATVRGTSMVPTLQDGQDIVILKTKNLNVGDIVVAIHPTYGLIVKRLTIIEGSQVYLTSDNKNVEITNTQTKLTNGSIETVTVQKTPLNTWLPTNNVIGVVKVY